MRRSSTPSYSIPVAQKILMTSTHHYSFPYLHPKSTCTHCFPFSSLSRTSQCIQIDVASKSQSNHPRPSRHHHPTRPKLHFPHPSSSIHPSARLEQLHIRKKQDPHHWLPFLPQSLDAASPPLPWHRESRTAADAGVTVYSTVVQLLHWASDSRVLAGLCGEDGVRRQSRGSGVGVET